MNDEQETEPLTEQVDELARDQAGERDPVSGDASETAIIEALASGVRDQFARPISTGLHLVATPIGNLGDITPRALVTIAKADYVYCEDTRVSRPMLARFAITRRLSAYHEHNAEAARREILAIISKGGSVALISDAGSPAISDPGFKLARDVIAAGAEVFVVPGPTALTAALTASGLPTDSFFFAGFLPQKSVSRRARIEELRSIPATLIFYESPHRVTASLQDLAETLGDRDAAVARELTKKYEEVRRGKLDELASWSAQTPPRGEIAIVVAPSAPADPADISDDDILTAVRKALPDMRPAAAAKEISQNLRVPRARVYDLILTLKQSKS